MSDPAGGGDYVSVVERLNAYIAELHDLVERRQGLQQASDERPEHLVELWDTISKALAQISAITADKALKTAAREQKYKFDEVADNMYQHMLKNYSSDREEMENYSRFRRGLRAQLDLLADWVSNLTLVICIVAYQSLRDPAGPDAPRDRKVS
jgi:hypothetical protein